MAKQLTLADIRLLLDEKIDPIMELARKHEQSLYGTTGDNGLNGDMKVIQAEVKDINKKIYKFTGAITAVGMILHVAWDNLKGKLG